MQKARNFAVGIWADSILLSALKNLIKTNTRILNTQQLNALTLVISHSNAY